MPVSTFRKYVRSVAGIRMFDDLLLDRLSHLEIHIVGSETEDATRLSQTPKVLSIPKSVAITSVPSWPLTSCLTVENPRESLSGKHEADRTLFSCATQLDSEIFSRNTNVRENWHPDGLPFCWDCDRIVQK